MSELYHVTQASLFACCEQCGNPFIPRPHTVAKFCSQKCYRASRKGRSLPANKNGIYKVCEYCGKEYYASAKRSLTQKFCNDDCYLAYQQEHKPPLYTFICETCGKPAAARQPDRHYCSVECTYKASHPDRKTGKYKNCAICGKEVYITRSRLGLPNYFCSHEHANEWQGRNKIEYTCKTCGSNFRRSASFEKFGRVLYCSPQCAYDDPDRQARLITMNLLQQQGKQTEPERIGYAILDELGIDYSPQYLIANKFCVDAFVPSIGLVIQFDGDYWHFNPVKFQEPDTRQRKRMRLDQSQDKYMKACGYTVLRIWESDLRTDTVKVRETIQHLLPPLSQ